jgi:hypothetical protein
VSGPAAGLPWARPDWRPRTDAWIGARLAGLGRRPTGAVEEVKMRPWSAVLRAPAAGGDVFFKANLPALANEPALTRVLARIDPDHVVPVLAEEPAERWMLQPDGGPTMRSRLDGRDDLRRWERMLALYAELQVRACGRVEELLAAGAPDRRPPELRALFERLVAAERGLPASSEALSDEERSRLRALAPRLAELAAELDAHGLPASIDHSDLHAGNVLAPGDGYVFFDWHEAAVAHPFFSMVVATRWLAHNHGVRAGSSEERRLHDAYLDAWAGHGSRASLRAALDLALRVGTLTRALGWMRVLEGLPAADQAEWAEYVPGWLRDLAAAVDPAASGPAMPY